MGGVSKIAYRWRRAMMACAGIWRKSQWAMAIMKNGGHMAKW